MPKKQEVQGVEETQEEAESNVNQCPAPSSLSTTEKTAKEREAEAFLETKQEERAQREDREQPETDVPGPFSPPLDPSTWENVNWDAWGPEEDLPDIDTRYFDWDENNSSHPS
jgi:hypothetical protein